MEGPLRQLAATCEQRLPTAGAGGWPAGLPGELAGWLGEPANTVSALAFVVAGVALLARRPGATAGPRRTPPVTYCLLVAAVGAGSVIQHGPHPSWQAYPHDLTLGAVLAFVAADGLADLVRRRTGGRWPPWWWLAPTGALVPLVAAGPGYATAGQAGLAAAAIGLGLARAWRRPRWRSRLLLALAVLGAGALIGTLSEQPAWCRPESLVQGHALWHLLAAVALWVLAPVVGTTGGSRRAPGRPRPGRPAPVTPRPRPGRPEHRSGQRPGR